MRGPPKATLDLTRATISSKALSAFPGKHILKADLKFMTNYFALLTFFWDVDGRAQL